MNSTVQIDPKFDKRIQELLTEWEETLKHMPVSAASGSLQAISDSIDAELERVYAARRQAYKDAGAFRLIQL